MGGYGGEVGEGEGVCYGCLVGVVYVGELFVVWVVVVGDDVGDFDFGWVWLGL